MAREGFPEEVAFEQSYLAGKGVLWLSGRKCSRCRGSRAKTLRWGQMGNVKEPLVGQQAFSEMRTEGSCRK